MNTPEHPEPSANGPSPDPALSTSPKALLAQLYSQLRAAAQQQMAKERHNHTLSATALVHEAWLRLAKQRDVPFVNRAHFYAVAVKMMRRILHDHGKARGSKKRGGGQQPIQLDLLLDIGIDEKVHEHVAVDEAIELLAKHDPRMAKVVEYRYFLGLSVAETAALLGVSESTIMNEWRFARALLARSLQQGG